MAVISIRVVPRASRSEVSCEMDDGTIKVRLQAPPVEGKANKALIEFLAGQLKVPKRTVSLEQGDKSRNKRIRIEGLSMADVKSRLGL